MQRTLIGFAVACALAACTPSGSEGDLTIYESPLGFSIGLPSKAFIGDVTETAPVVAFEDPARSRVFIATAEHDDPATPGFNRKETTLDALTGSDAYLIPSWLMSMTEIENDAALATWIKDHYGPGCTIEEQAASDQEGVFDIILESDGLPLDETRCPLIYVYEILYQPSKKRVLSWTLGQDVRFISDLYGKDVYDLEMIESIRLK